MKIPDEDIFVVRTLARWSALESFVSVEVMSEKERIGLFESLPENQKRLIILFEKEKKEMIERFKEKGFEG